jgi:membrane fusion protein (multidrug efflux system)
MATKIIYPLVAVIGIAAASGAAWWYQQPNKSIAEIVTLKLAAGPAPATGAPGGGGGGGGGGGAPGGPRAMGVEVTQVTKISIRDDAQTVGTLRSRQNVMLRPEVAGRVLSLGFTDGNRVRAGQMLVQLDDTLQRAEVQQSLAQVSIASANHKRNQDLVAQNFVAQRVLDESGASLQVAQAQLALSCARLDRMRIIAPFSGTVGIRNVNIGDYVKDGADLINLEDIANLYVDFRLPERNQGKVVAGQVVELDIDAMPGRTFKAKVEAVDPLIDANGRSIGVRAVMANTAGEASLPPGGGKGGAGGAKGGAPGAAAAPTGKPSAPANAARTPAAVAPSPVAAAVAAPLPSGCPPNVLSSRVSELPAAGPSGPLRPGMFARVTAVFAFKPEALAVPEEAIVPQAGRQFVFKLVDPSTMENLGALPPDTKWVSKRVEVSIGIRRPGQVEILTGLAEGDTVVLAGQQRLQKDGTAVRVVELGRPGGAGKPPTPGAPTNPGAGAPGTPAAAPSGAPAPASSDTGPKAGATPPASR